MISYDGHFYSVYLFLLAVFAFPACERVTDLRPEGNGTVVVACVLTQEEKQILRLSLTDQASAMENEQLKKAVVQVYDETEMRLAGKFTFVENNRWESNFAAIPLHNYRLEIDVDGLSRVSARTTMPDLPQIKAVIKKPVKETETIEDAFPDNEAGIRFQTSSLPQGAVWIIRKDHNPSSGELIICEEIATSLLNVDPFNLTGSNLRFSYIGPGSTLDNQLPSGPMVITAFYRYVQEQPLHNVYLRIPPVWEGGERETKDPDDFFSVAGDSFTSDYDWRGLKEEQERGYLLFMSVSEEYDRFLKELLIEERNIEQSKDFFAALFKHENIFSNIEGGTGIFGSYSQARSFWNYGQFAEAPLHLLETP